MKMDKGDVIIIFLIGFAVGIWATGISISYFVYHNVQPSEIPTKETLNDICHNLANQTSIGHIVDRKLICSIPSYDSTQNIIIKSNSDNNERGDD